MCVCVVWHRSECMSCACMDYVLDPLAVFWRVVHAGIGG